MAKKAKVDLDSIIGMCRFCTKPLGESPPPACAECVEQESRRPTKLNESDPYKSTWNAVEDEEASLLSWIKNGTLFVPTREELAKRHLSVAHHQLRKARSLGRSAEGIEAFNEALFQRKMAKTLFDKQREIVLCSS